MNENSDGLPRQYFLHGTDPSRWSADEVGSVAHGLTGRVATCADNAAMVTWIERKNHGRRRQRGLGRLIQVKLRRLHGRTRRLRTTRPE